VRAVAGRPGIAGVLTTLFDDVMHGKDDLLTAMSVSCNPYYLVVCVYKHGYGRCAYCNGTGKSGGNKPLTTDGSGMPADEREDTILRFLEQHGIPLPPAVIFRGLKIQENITFAYRTVQDILKRLNEQGLVMRCSKEALDEGRIEKLPDDETGRRTYYFITEEGKSRIHSDS